jgi:hypothetical protein
MRILLEGAKTCNTEAAGGHCEKRLRLALQTLQEDTVRKG